MSVKHQAISSTLWTVARVVLDQVFSLLVFVVVARLLGPVEVGLFALGMIVSEMGRIFSTSGFGDVVTKARPEDEEETAQAAFWGNMFTAFLCAILFTLLAQPISMMLHSPRLVSIIIALAWTIPISASYAIHLARQLKRFGHKSLTIRSLISGLIGGAVAIAAAYAGAGVWSLVIQRVVTEVVTLVTIWLSYRWVPSFSFSWERMKEIFPFSSQMSLSKLVNLLMSRFQDIIIGAFISSAGVGIYRVAKRTFDMLSTGAMTPFSTVSLNLFAAVRDDPVKMRNAVIRVIALSATAAFPIIFGVAAVADDLIPLVYGNKWHDSIILLQMLTPVGVPMLFSLLSLSILTVYGEARSVSFITGIQFALTVGLGLAAAPFGINAVILSYLARLYIVMPYQIALVARHVGLSRGRLVMAMGRPLLASLLMTILCYVMLRQLHAVVPWAFVRLAITGTFGMVFYVALLWAIDRQSLLWLVDMLRAFSRGRSRPAIVGLA